MAVACLLLSILILQLPRRSSAIVASVVPQDPVVEFGSDVTLNCTLRPTANGHRTAHNVIWRNDTAPLPQDLYTAVSDTMSQLSLTNVTLSATGTYYCCFPGDGLLQRMLSASVVSVGKKPKPAILDCVIPSPDAYRCSWKEGTHTNIKTKHKFTIWNHESRSWAGCPAVMPNNTCPVSLHQIINQDQRVRVVSSNTLGEASSMKTFNIHRDVVVNPPGNVELTEVRTAASLTVTWAVPGEWPSSRAGSLMYKLRFRKDDCAMANQTSCYWTEIPDSGSLLYTLRGLDPYTVYSIQMAARYDGSWEDNWSIWSEAVTATTRETIPIDTVRDLRPTQQNNRADPVYKRDLQIFWTSLSEGSPHGRLLGYKVVVESDDPTEPRRERETQHGWIAVTGLQKFCGYRIKVAAHNCIGEGPWSFSYVADRTTTPTVPDEVSAVPLTATSILVEWVEPRQPNGYIEHYIVQWGRSNRNKETYVTPNASQRSYLIEELETFALYKVSVKIQNSHGEGRFRSARGEVRTLEGVPDAPPANLVVSSVPDQPEHLALSWQRLPFENVNGKLAGYLISFCRNEMLQNSSGKVQQKNLSRPDSLSTTLTDLQPATSYSVWLAAYTAVGTGPESDPVQGRTAEENQAILLAVFIPFAVLLGLVLLSVSALRGRDILPCFQHAGNVELSKKVHLKSSSKVQQQCCDDILPPPHFTTVSGTLEHGKCELAEEILQTSSGPQPIFMSVTLDPKTHVMKCNRSASGDSGVPPSPDCVGLQGKRGVAGDGDDGLFLEDKNGELPAIELEKLRVQFASAEDTGSN